MTWINSVSDDQLSESDEDDTDRLFTFEVAKTKEQEEGVSVRQGFEVCRLSIFYPSMNTLSDFSVHFRRAHRHRAASRV